MYYMYFWIPIILQSASTAEIHRKLSESIDSFALKLYQVLPNQNSNLIFSPLCAHISLSMAYQGSSGETARAFREKLELRDKLSNAVQYRHLMSKLNQSDHLEVLFANKIYIKNRYRLARNFRQIVSYYFSADAGNINFLNAKNAAEEINSWVREKTERKIDRLVAPSDFDENTRAVLISALFLNGNWQKRFDVNNTRKIWFFVNSHKSVYLPMMSQTEYFYYREDVELDSQIVKIYLRDKHFSMVIILPRSRTGVQKLGRRLVYRNISSLIDKNELKRRVVKLMIPKFKIETTLNLKYPLIEMGLGKMFSYFADYTPMINKRDSLTVNKFVQKSLIQVNEKGVIAAAATGLQVKHRKIAAGPPVTFNANHPFIFYVIAEFDDKRANVLFMGRVNNPLE